MSRFHDAHLIAQGACNPSGVARSLVKAIDEARQECPDTDSVRSDPACRLITYQLAYLMGMEPLSSAYTAFASTEQERKDNVPPTKFGQDSQLCERVAALTEAQYTKLREMWIALKQDAADGEGQAAPGPFPAFLAAAQLVIGTDDKDGHSAVAVRRCGMWLCIEPDGYCHT